MSETDGIKWHASAHIDKYSAEQVAWATAHLGYEPKGAELMVLFSHPEDGIVDVDGNLITTAGLGAVTNLVTGIGGQVFSNARGIVGVGSTSTAAAAADTALGANGTTPNGTVGAWYQGIDASGLSRVTTAVTNDTIQAVATFASADANMAWNEWGWATSTSGTITPSATLTSVATGTLFFNHKIPAGGMGTKASGASWVFTTKVQFS